MPLAEKVRECASSNIHIDIFYEEFGNKNATPLLLLPGLNAQSVMFEDAFCEEMAKAGPFRVIRMDNRDTGFSSKCDHQGQPWKYALVAPTFLSPKPHYTLECMARDAWALLDRLGVERAVVAGNSMGGMLAQWCALQRPERTIALIPQMTTTQGSGLPKPPLWVQASFLGAPSNPDDIECVTKYKTEWVSKVLLPPAHRRDEATMEYVKQHISKGANRTMYRAGIFRQMMAINHTRGREQYLRDLKTPTLVIHGSHDNIFAPEHAHRFKEVMPHSKVEIIQDMGHFFEPKHFKPVAEMIAEFVQQNASSSSSSDEDRCLPPARRQRS